MYPVVLEGHHELVPGRHRHDLLRHRQHPARIDDGDTDALVAQPLGHRQRHGGERADRDEQDIIRQTLHRSSQHVDHAAPLQGRNLLSHIPLGEADGGGPVVDVDRLGEFLGESGAIPGGGDPHPGHHAEDREIPHAVVAGAIGAGDARAVQHHRDRQLVQRYVHHDLVEGAVEERRVDGDDRVHTAHRQAGRGGHRMLLGDPHVEEPIGVLGPERIEAGGAWHRRGDRHHVAPFGRDLDERVGERRCPARARHRSRQAGLGIDDAAGVHLVVLVVLGRGVTHTFAGHDVHDHRGVERPRVTQRVLHRVFVVTVDRPDVLEAEVGEHHLRTQRVLDARLDAVHALIAEFADHRDAADRLAPLLEHPLVAGLQPQCCQVFGEPTDGGRVAAAVVVDDDHHRPAGGGDVVHRLPAHAPGERAVADHGDHVPVAVTVELERLGQSVGVGQRRTGMAGLHPVVLALAPRRISRQAVLLAQRLEIAAATGQHLVHVGLMSGVEQDRVVRRVEDAVQCQRQFHDAQVGSQVPARRRDLVDQEVADFSSQLFQLRLCQVLQISGTADLFKHSASLRTVSGSVLSRLVHIGHTVLVLVDGLLVAYAPVGGVPAQQQQ